MCRERSRLPFIAHRTHDGRRISQCTHGRAASVCLACETACASRLRRELMKDEDFVPMIANGRQLALEGVTTVEELVRTIVTVE